MSESSLSPAYRTDLIAFVLDQLDFMECKINEACADQASQKGAVLEACGIIPQVRARLWSEAPDKATQCLFGSPHLIEQDAADWWGKLAGMDRDEFQQEALALLDPKTGGIAVARAVLRG